MKNILLLAMSTFSHCDYGDSNLVKYHCNMGGDWNDCEVEGITQLEPIPKLLIKQLRKKGEDLSHIILLSTDATDKKVPVNFDGYPDTRLASPVSFFEDRIDECRGKSRMSPGDDFYRVIKIDQSKPSWAICKALESIREFRKSDEICLWIDTHGGFRGIQLVIEAMLSILKVEQIIPEEIFRIEWKPGDKDGYICSDEESFRIFDFAAGMNEFLNYGRANTLVNYFNAGEGYDMELIQNIMKISSAIQLCDMEAFERSLVEMGGYIKNRTEVDGNSGSDYLGLFVGNISKDYGILLTEKRTTVDMIKWCMRKEFFQQALTLVEGWMPKELFKCNIVRYDPEETIKWTNKDKSNNCNDLVEERKLKDILSIVIKKYEEMNNYVFDRCVNSLVSSNAQDDKNFILLDKEKKEDYYRNIEAEDGLTESKDYCLSCRIGLNSRHVKKLKLKCDKQSYSVEIKVYSNLTAMKQYLTNFLLLHASLKNQRNIVNHAKEDKGRATVEHLKTALEAYCNMASVLFDYEENRTEGSNYEG